MPGKTPAATSATKSAAQRLPAPSLFVGPPSRNVSSTNLAPQPDNKPILSRQRSLLGERTRNEPGLDSGLRAPQTPADATLGPFSRRQQQQQAQAESNNAQRTEAAWAEMQNTLEEVELNAISGTHVFGPGHSKALDELRRAQIELAQAWAKSEAEEETREDGDAVKGGGKTFGTADMLASDRAEKFGRAGEGGRARQGSTGSKSRLEEETENDILLARKRREANDRYFQRVNQGVLDVVDKLEEVARAMRGVEAESKEIWGDGESMDSASVT